MLRILTLRGCRVLRDSQRWSPEPEGRRCRQRRRAPNARRDGPEPRAAWCVLDA